MSKVIDGEIDELGTAFGRTRLRHSSGSEVELLSDSDDQLRDEQVHSTPSRSTAHRPAQTPTPSKLGKPRLTISPHLFKSIPKNQSNQIRKTIIDQLDELIAMDESEVKKFVKTSARKAMEGIKTALPGRSADSILEEFDTLLDSISVLPKLVEYKARVDAYEAQESSQPTDPSAQSPHPPPLPSTPVTTPPSSAEQHSTKTPKKEKAKKEKKVLKGKCLVVKDGDTISVQPEDGGEKINVRFAAIDAPEKAQEHGPASRLYLKELIEGKEVTLVVQNIDLYGRHVCDVHVGEIFVQAEMLKGGHAWHYASFDKRKELSELQEEARSKKIGLWQYPDPTPPWEWRKAKKGHATAAAATSSLD